MSVLTHKSAQVVIERPKLGRRRLVWLAAVAVIAAATISLAFGVLGGDEGTNVPTNATPAAKALNLAPGVRYDGGPEEGTRGIAGGTPGVRYDGGPEEGTRGIVGGTPGVRYDGGPEEGSRGIGR